MATWTTLSDGLLGAVMGGVAVFGAAALTLWRSRVGDRKREDTRLKEADFQQRQRYTIEVIGVLRALEREVRAAPFRRAHGQAEFIRASGLFYMTQKRQHPAVAIWVAARNNEYVRLADRWQKLFWCPVVRQRRLGQLGRYVGQVLAALVLWASDELPDSAFDDPKWSPEDVIEAAQLQASHPAR